MRSIIVFKKDGKKEEFHHQGRPGGSYSISIKYEEGFAIVEDEWDNQTIFPESNIDHIKTTSLR